MDSLGNAASNFSQTLMNATVQKWVKFLTAMIQAWLHDRPIIAWFITHPLISLGILLVILVLLKGFIDAIARITEHLWLAIFKTPVVLIRQIGQGLQRVLSRTSAIAQTPTTPLTAAATETPRQRLAIVLNRLESLKAEQDELLQEVRAILAAESTHSQPLE